MIDGFLRNAGKHVANRAVSKIGSGYSKANNKLKGKIKSAAGNFKIAKKREQSDAKAEKKMQQRLSKVTQRARRDQKRTGLYVVRGKGGRG